MTVRWWSWSRHCSRWVMTPNCGWSKNLLLRIPQGSPFFWSSHIKTDNLCACATCMLAHVFKYECWIRVELSWNTAQARQDKTDKAQNETKIWRLHSLTCVHGGFSVRNRSITHEKSTFRTGHCALWTSRMTSYHNAFKFSIPRCNRVESTFLVIKEVNFKGFRGTTGDKQSNRHRCPINLETRQGGVKKKRKWKNKGGFGVSVRLHAGDKR